MWWLVKYYRWKRGKHRMIQLGWHLTPMDHLSPPFTWQTHHHIGQETTADVCLAWRKWFWAYRPEVKVTKSVSEQVCAWSEAVISALQHCFDTTDWDTFKQTCNIHTVSICFNNRRDARKTVALYSDQCQRHISAGQLKKLPWMIWTNMPRQSIPPTPQPHNQALYLSLASLKRTFHHQQLLGRWPRQHLWSCAERPVLRSLSLSSQTSSTHPWDHQRAAVERLSSKCLGVRIRTSPEQPTTILLARKYNPSSARQEPLHPQHPDQIHHCAVWQLHWTARPLSTVNTGQQDCWHPSPFTPGHFQYLPRLTSSACCHQGGRIRTSVSPPPDPQTASSSSHPLL